MLRTTKPAKCQVCKRRLEHIGQRLHDGCVDTWISRQLAKQAAAKKRKAEAAKKQERTQHLEAKAKAKKATAWEAECRAIVQEIARIRDRNDYCISCDMVPTYGGQWHGSHFRSVGACSALQFHLWNIHKACSQCNYHKSGNIAEYRPRLVAKIGQDRVDWLDAQHGLVKHTPQYVEYLIRFKKVMGKRLRRMKKRLENA